MSIYVSSLLCGINKLKNEGVDIYVDNNIKCEKNIGIINLMPTKGETESQLLRLLSNSSNENIRVEFIKLESYKPKHTNYEYLNKNYKKFCKIKNSLDALILTGAPIEKLDFDEVYYIEELRQILDYIRENKKASIYICWGAQVALNHYYGVDKILKEEKIFGVFSHEIVCDDYILKGINNGFKCPHSRYTSLDKNALQKNTLIKTLCITSDGEEHILKGIFNDYYFLGHSEYDRNTLKFEYLRDLETGLNIKMPKNYFIENSLEHIHENWQNEAITLYKNWLELI